VPRFWRIFPALLGVCLVATVAVAAPARAPKAPKIAERSLACLTQTRVEAIRAHPATIRDVFASCDRELARKVPFADAGFQRHAVLASLVAYSMAPYGPSRAVTLPALLRATTMNCGNYGWMTFNLLRRGWGEKEALRLWQSGWDHGAVGNHAQVHAGDVLLDPTIGAVARVRYREVKHGVPAHAVVAFPHRADIDAFARRVIDALANGRYRPSDVLYRQDYSTWRTAGSG
jgi:hypothetical protein